MVFLRGFRSEISVCVCVLILSAESRRRRRERGEGMDAWRYVRFAWKSNI